MGGGRFDENDYHAGRAIRASRGISDFQYTETATHVHADLDPHRILNKPFKKLESRDSSEHPVSVPVILTCDVTGPNIHNARIVQQKLPELMGKLTAVCENPQIAIWANDDTFACGKNAIQLSEFESDNRIDDSIRKLWLTGRGGSNDGESYDLLIYAAARKTVTDSVEKRGKKGYLFLYADEPFFEYVSARDVQAIFGDKIQEDIPIGNIVAEAQKKWHIFVIWPQDGFTHARRQYEELFGVDNVESLQSPEQLCDKVASIVSRVEEEYKQQPVLEEDYIDRVV